MVQRKRSDAAAGGSSVDAGASSAVGKAFAVLKTLRHASGALTLTVIAEEIGVAPSSAHSILGHLLAEGAVTQLPDKRYLLGPQLFYLGASFARGTPIYRSTWMELVSAAADLGVTAAVAVPWDGHHLILNSHRAGESEVAIPFGGRVPLAAASWGKVYYAWSGEAPPEELGKYTSVSITDPTVFAEAVAEAKRLGYGIDEGEFFDGVGGACAPVTSVYGYEGLASFIAPLPRVETIDAHVLGRRLAAITARASLALGDSDRFKFFGVE
ncbi:IclR family transcriptional regulator [Pseudonocardia alni]|uniref:IclR family transcriptional regulator n=1 Tax=Pseudonocardia alni TaxID=33907 RepID=UPI0033173AE6